jgi:hypothetical protein
VSLCLCGSLFSINAKASNNSDIDIASLGKPALRLFTDKDGLPQNFVFVIAFDHKGYLWVGTQDGLAYFNGRKWNVVDMSNKAASKTITDILVASDGSIWFSRQGGISRLKDGEWTTFDTGNGLPNNVVWDLMETTSSEGERLIWAAPSGGVARLQAGKWTIYDTRYGFPSNDIDERLGFEIETAKFSAECKQSLSSLQSIAGRTDENWGQAEKIFYSVLEREPEKRAGYLDEACAGDEALRRRVEWLIANDEKLEAMSFLRSPIANTLKKPPTEPAESIKQLPDGKPVKE